ncbi:MAG: toxin RelE [Candidatus Tectimicrobiota bacterium]|nr:MAG: toxin RelE [Candidatus Tectomicrobia bacterium]
MKLEFRASFAKDLKRIRDKPLLRRVKETINDVEAATSIREIKDLKKLRTEGRYYRIRLGDYRIGLIIEGDTVIFVRILHRSEIYRYFP